MTALFVSRLDWTRKNSKKIADLDVAKDPHSAAMLLHRFLHYFYIFDCNNNLNFPFVVFTLDRLFLECFCLDPYIAVLLPP